MSHFTNVRRRCRSGTSRRRPLVAGVDEPFHGLGKRINVYAHHRERACNGNFAGGFVQGECARARGSHERARLQEKTGYAALRIFRHFADTCDDGDCAVRLAERYGSIVHLDGERTVIVQRRQRIIPFGKRLYNLFVCQIRSPPALRRLARRPGRRSEGCRRR